MIDKSIPDIIVGRLPRYLQTLEHMQIQGIQTISSLELGQKIGISAAQIRKDLSQFGEFGKQGKGYSIPYLVDQLQQILNVNRVWNIALVGAGNLGHAIANYQDFAHHGYQITLIFDSSPERIGTQLGGLTIQNSAEMIQIIHNSDVRIGMITVPPLAAQSVANDLVKAGVKAILNYAPIALTVPEDVHVQAIDPIIYLQRMTYYLE
jgi:redox-sensing transcriptional repressor